MHGLRVVQEPGVRSAPGVAVAVAHHQVARVVGPVDGPAGPEDVLDQRMVDMAARRRGARRQQCGRPERDCVELMDMFPSEDAATKWFERWVWPTGRACGKCGSVDTYEVPNAKPMPYRCRDCKSYFSVRTGTAIERSKVPLRKWAITIYLELTSLKSVSSMKLHRDLKVTQKTAWFMLHRIRQAWADESGEPFDGPVEVDETYMGGIRKNMPNHVRAQWLGSGVAGKAPVVGIRDRATNQVRARHVRTASKENLHGFVTENVDPDATVYTDEAMIVTAHPPASGFEVFVTVGERSGMWLSGMVCGWGSLMVTGG